MRGNWNQFVTDAEVREIVRDIDQKGYGSISNYLAADELAPIQSFAENAVRAAGGEYVGFNGPDALVGTVLADLPRSSEFKDLCRRLYEFGTGKKGPEVDFYQVFRCLQGSSGQRHSYKFHYDSYVLTALLPISIPKEGQPGDLIVLPSMRPIRRSYFVNILDKAVVDNRVGHRVLREVARQKWLNTVAIRMQPGNIYFFWGYRSVHTNEPCDPDKLRATALFHYGDPHRDSPSRNLMRSVRRKRSG